MHQSKSNPSGQFSVGVNTTGSLGREKSGRRMSLPGREEPIALAGRSRSTPRLAHRCCVAAAGGAAVGVLAGCRMAASGAGCHWDANSDRPSTVLKRRSPIEVVLQLLADLRWSPVSHRCDIPMGRRTADRVPHGERRTCHSQSSSTWRPGASLPCRRLSAHTHSVLLVSTSLRSGT